MHPVLHNDKNGLYRISPFIIGTSDAAPLNPHTGNPLSMDKRTRGMIRFFVRPRKLSDAQKLFPYQLMSKFLSEKIIIPVTDDPAKIFRLKYVQIDTNRGCNLRCNFCPNATNHRTFQTMPFKLFRSIINKLRAYKKDIKAISFSSYNEPTIDPLFIKRVALIRKYGFPYWFISNASGLTRTVAKSLLKLGVKKGAITLNVPFAPSGKYKKLLESRISHITLAARLGMHLDIRVNGAGDTNHALEITALKHIFKDTPRISISGGSIIDRAGALRNKFAQHIHNRRLYGCECNASRPFNWLHINTKGICFLCCQDYHEHYTIGDISKESVQEIMAGERATRLRRWVYGITQAPRSFICRRCCFAATKRSQEWF